MARSIFPLSADTGLIREVQSGRFASIGSCPKRSGTSIWALVTSPYRPLVTGCVEATFFAKCSVLMGDHLFFRPPRSQWSSRAQPEQRVLCLQRPKIPIPSSLSGAPRVR